MAITKSVAAQNAACDAVVNLLDGTDSTSGSLNLYNVDSTALVSLPLSVSAFMDSTDGTSVANTIKDATAYMDGTVSTFSFVDMDGTSVWGGSVSAIGGGGDMEINSVVIPTDTTVSIFSATYVVP